MVVVQKKKNIFVAENGSMFVTLVLAAVFA